MALHSRRPVEDSPRGAATEARQLIRIPVSRIQGLTEPHKVKRKFPCTYVGVAAHYRAEVPGSALLLTRRSPKAKGAGNHVCPLPEDAVHL